MTAAGSPLCCACQHMAAPLPQLHPPGGIVSTAQYQKAAPLRAQHLRGCPAVKSETRPHPLVYSRCCFSLLVHAMPRQKAYHLRGSDSPHCSFFCIPLTSAWVMRQQDDNCRDIDPVGSKRQGSAEIAMHLRLDVGTSFKKNFDCRRVIADCGNM